jgi:ABC-type amino acid transport substrate-binding protein/chorismate mutase
MTWLRRFAVAWLATACAPSGPPQVGPGEGERLQSAPSVAAAPSEGRAELRVGTSGDYAPFSVSAAPGSVRGFDAELAQAMAEDLGFKLRWVMFRWTALPHDLADGRFDVAMSGITWQPARAVLGYMTRAVARGGPCLLGDPRAARVGVNRGGALETWSHAHLSERELVLVDDNQSLPELLASARVGAIVTDSFEQRLFRRSSWALTCEPPLARKVYWVGPGHDGLGPRIDGWLAGHRGLVQAAQERWFGERQRLDDVADLVDLLARRIAFMPLVAELKSRRGAPIEDVARERTVVERGASSARARGLPDRPVRQFFELQIELSKAVQRRMREDSALDLEQQIRPELNELGERIVDALAKARAANGLAGCTLDDLEPLSPWLNASERALLLAGLRAFD